ncbi:MAG: sulfite exporter TauE/SafE family protein [Gammaproteobacteria bacterium]|nr:sulfite exporter TauE/SafE family protein [Gammaproteobacteria bacterium]
MTSLLWLGFLIGMRHALEADHLAAVASIASQQNSIRSTLKHGAIWGLGHTTTLFLFGSVVIWMDTIIPQQLAQALELVVGLMLIVLGLDVLRRVWRDRVHYHVHRHDHQAHFHAHSHAGESNHQVSKHAHSHDRKFPFRTLMIGFMHGLAGSAALILLTMDTTQSLWLGMGYMFLFGVGSIIGMALLSLIIAIPLRASAKGLTWVHNGLQAVIGLLTCLLGTGIVVSMS